MLDKKCTNLISCEVPFSFVLIYTYCYYLRSSERSIVVTYQPTDPSSPSTKTPEASEARQKSQHESKSMPYSVTTVQAKLEKAYDTMLSRLKDQLEDVSKRKPNIDEMITKAKNKAVTLGELTEEESEQIKKYIERDLQEAAVFLKEAKKTLADWLNFDYKLIEEKCWETFNAVIEQVKAEWVEFNQRIAHSKEYTAGEVVGMGALTCAQCHETIHFTKSTTIPVCPQCKHDKFFRQ